MLRGKITQKRNNNIIFLNILILLITSLVHAELTVDLNKTKGIVSHRASGFLWGLSKDKPPRELIKPLKIKKYRSRLTPWIKGSGIDSFQRVNELGASIQVVVSDEYKPALQR